VFKAPEPYVPAVLLATPELAGTRAPLEVRPPEELRCPPPTGVVAPEDPCAELEPLVVPDAVADEPLVVPEAVGAALVLDDAAGEGAGAGAGAAVATGVAAVAEDGGGGAGGVDGVP
jgi:hypothetical protein